MSNYMSQDQISVRAGIAQDVMNQGLSQETAAQEAGVSQSTLSHRLKGGKSHTTAGQGLLKLLPDVDTNIVKYILLARELR